MRPEPNLIGDRRAGCACAYVHFEQVAPSGRQRKQTQAPAPNHLQNVDLLLSSTGRVQNRFFCQQSLTKSFPEALRQAPEYAPRNPMRALQWLRNIIAKGFVTTFRFLFPRIQTAVGIQLWRWQP